MNGEIQVREFFENINRERLLDFLAEYAASDAKFANAVNVHFGRPEFEEELKKIEKTVNSAFNGMKYYGDRDNWRYLDIDTNTIVDEIEQRTRQGHIRLAFAEIEILYRKLVENFEYQEECEVSDEAESCLDIMSEIAAKATREEDKKYIFERCIALSEFDEGKDYGADYEDRLLSVAVKFVTSENRATLEKVLARFDSGWRAEAFRLIQLEIARTLGSEDTANAFITENVQFPKFRTILFDKAVLRKDYSEAAKLCVDALASEKQQWGISRWLYKLYSVYEVSKNAIEMTKTAERILLSGDLEYYEKLKVQRKEQNTWDKLYSELLEKCKLKLSYHKYMEILAKEEEYSLLLEQVKDHVEQIYSYGKLLGKEYPTDICRMFLEKIDKEAEAATNRSAYNRR